MKHENTIVIGDLHGQEELTQKILRLKDRYNLVFVGDYLDSYTRSIPEQLSTLTMIVSAARTDENVVALMGNHERSYLFNETCGGRKQDTYEYVNYYRKEIKETLLEHYWLAENILITHAGVSLDAIPYSPENDEIVCVNKFLASPNRLSVGYSRGGRQRVGGIFWCDFNLEFIPIPGLTQIFGHTRGNGIRELEGNFCIDCLEDEPKELLLVDSSLTMTKVGLDEIL